MKAEKFWDILAKNYDAGEGDPSEREDLEIIHKYMQPEDTVLELACGTGTLAIHIAGWVNEIHAIDVSGKMIAIAEGKAAEHQVNNIHFAHTTIIEARYPNEFFNVVMAFNILHLLKDARKAVQRINQIIKAWRCVHFVNSLSGREKVICEPPAFSHLYCPKQNWDHPIHQSI